MIVVVAKLKCALVEPASLCAVRRNWYHVAGKRSRIDSCSAGALLSTSNQFRLFPFSKRYSATKYTMAQPPSGHNDSCSVTEVAFPENSSLELGSSGTGKIFCVDNTNVKE